LVITIPKNALILKNVFAYDTKKREKKLLSKDSRNL